MRWIWFLAILSVLGANACGAFNDNYSKEFHGDSIHDTSPCNSFSYMTLQSLEPMQIISIIFLGDGQGKHGQINLEENEDDEEQAVRNDNGSPTIQSAKTGHSDLKDDQLKRLFNGIIGYGNDPEAFDLAGKQAMDEINVENTEIEFNYDTNSNCGGRGYVDVFTKYDKNDDDKFCVAGDGHDLGRNVDVYRKKVCKQHGTGTGGDDEGRNEMEEDLTNIFGNYGDSVQDMFFCVDADYIHVDGEGVNEQTDLLDAGLMEINEDEEEEDEEQEVRNNNISPTTQSAQTSDSDPTDDQLKRLFNGMNCYGDDPSRSTLENFDYSYDAKGDDDDEDDMETGSVQFHSSPDEDDDDEDGGGSVQYHSSAEEEDEEEESDGGGSMQMHPDMENNEDWFGDDTQNGVYDDDEEDQDGSGGGGSVQMNDVENNEDWVDEEFDTKSIEIKASDDEENEEMNKKIDDMLESVDIVNEARTMINKENATESGQDNKEDVMQEGKKEEVKFDGDIGNIIRSGGRSRRLEQMKKHRNHKDHKTDVKDLDGLKQKYRDRRRHRERVEVGLFSINDLVKGDSHEEEIDDAEFSLEQFVNDNKEMVENMDEDDDDDEEQDEPDEDRDDGKEEKKMDPYRFDDDHDDEFNVPALPQKKKSVVLDIEKYSSNLAAVIEEDGDDDDDEEKYFQTVEYQTDSDCDSNDSVVVKKEILKNVTVNDLQKFDTV